MVFFEISALRKMSSATPATLTDLISEMRSLGKVDRHLQGYVPIFVEVPIDAVDEISHMGRKERRLKLHGDLGAMTGVSFVKNKTVTGVIWIEMNGIDKQPEAVATKLENLVKDLKTMLLQGYVYQDGAPSTLVSRFKAVRIPDQQQQPLQQCILM